MHPLYAALLLLSVIATLIVVICVAFRLGKLERNFEEQRFANRAYSAKTEQAPFYSPEWPEQEQAPYLSPPATAPLPIAPPAAMPLPYPPPPIVQPPATMPLPVPPATAYSMPAFEPTATAIPIIQPADDTPPLAYATTQTQAQFQPPQPQQPQHQTQPAAQKPSSSAGRSYEAIVGKNIVGIVASVLVFLGLIFLGFLVTPYLNDTVKIILMFAISSALAAAGYLLNRRYANNFTKTLLGTGCGAFFIAIQITHLYFNAINDVAAFSMLLVWIAGSLFMTRQSQSLLVGIVAHVGMIFSVCSGYLVGMSDDRVLLLLGYQLVSTVLIVAGNVLWFKKLYRFGLFASLSLTVYASAVMWAHFFGSGPLFASSLPLALISAAFIIQFVGSSFLAYLLFVSIARVKSPGNCVLLQLLNLTLWHGALFLNVTALIVRLCAIAAQSSAIPFPNPYDAFLPALIVTLIIMYALATLTVVLRRRLRFNPALEKTTVLFLLMTSCLLLFYNTVLHSASNTNGPTILLLAIPAAVGILVWRISGARLYVNSVFGILAFEVFAMCLFGYSELARFGGVALSAIYFVALMALVAVIFALLNPKERKRLWESLKIAIILVFQVSLLTILVFDVSLGGIIGKTDLSFGIALFELLCISALFAAHLFKQDNPRSFFRTNEYILYLILSVEFVNNGMAKTDAATTILHIAAVLCALVFICNRFRLAALKNAAALRAPGSPLPNTDAEVLGALAFHVVIVSALQGLTGWLDQAYALSLASMVVALVIIALGFWSRVRSLRLYGLVVVILCVLKLVTFDLYGLDTLMRVVAFIGGGIICFGISALYNFAVKRFNAEKSAQQKTLKNPPH